MSLVEILTELRDRDSGGAQAADLTARTDANGDTWQDNTYAVLAEPYWLDMPTEPSAFTNLP